jgi:DNA-binding response OmpR family regulator
MLKRRPRVLIIDDDDDVRSLIEATLSKAGIDVASAADGAVAIDMLECEGFDLMITDLWLRSEIDGIETVRRARARHPELRSLFISGCADPAVDDPELDDFVSKPFNLVELLGCVWELLTRVASNEQMLEACEDSLIGKREWTRHTASFH